MPTFAPANANADVRALTDLLNAAFVGDVVTYESMSEAIGAPVLRRRWLIYKALALSNEETGALFDSVIRTGHKRLTPDETHYVGHGARRRIRRSSRRAAKMMGRSIDMANDIDPIMKRKVYAEMNTLGLIEHLSRDRAVNHVAKQSDKPMPVAQVMRNMLDQLGVQPGLQTE